MNKLMLASAILIGLSASANARDVFLLCRMDDAPFAAGFNIRVDLENSALSRSDPSSFSRYDATITPEYIEYAEGMFKTRIDRNSGDLVAWSYTGSMARGSCEKTDDPRRLEENICCFVKPKE